VLFEWASEAVPGLPAYTTPACPAGLNGDPGAVAELPGITGLDGPQVLVGAPGWPVVGLTVAAAVVAVATISPSRQKTMITSFPIVNSINQYPDSTAAIYAATLRLYPLRLRSPATIQACAVKKWSRAVSGGLTEVLVKHDAKRSWHIPVRCPRL
jgi:hypothetical protein